MRPKYLGLGVKVRIVLNVEESKQETFTKNIEKYSLDKMFRCLKLDKEVYEVKVLPSLAISSFELLR